MVSAESARRGSYRRYIFVFLLFAGVYRIELVRGRMRFNFLHPGTMNMGMLGVFKVRKYG
jgi:hypothetical protein